MLKLTRADGRIAFNFAIYNLKNKSEGTYLGWLWYIVEPAILFFIFLFIRFAAFANNPTITPAFILLGVLIVHFFIRTTTLMSDAIVSNYGLLESRKLNPFIFIISRFIQSCIIHFVELSIATLVLAFFFKTYIFMYILFFPLLALFTFFIGATLAIIMTKILDISYAWKFICQSLYFLTPIFYIPSIQYSIFIYNPLAILLQIIRTGIFTMTFLFKEILLIVGITVILAVVYASLYFYFKKNITERSF
jgi:ABC-type polysaccharide/polyol phosphate export permease